MKKNQDVYLYSLHRDAKDILNDGSELMVVNNDEERYNEEGDWSEEEFGSVEIGDERFFMGYEEIRLTVRSILSI